MYTEEWNDVCGDNWGVEEMNVACRQQGYLPRHPLNFPIGRPSFFTSRQVPFFKMPL